MIDDDATATDPFFTLFPHEGGIGVRFSRGECDYNEDHGEQYTMTMTRANALSLAAALEVYLSGSWSRSA